VDFNSRESYDGEALTGWPGKVLIIESTDDPMINEEERARLRAAYPQAMLCTFEDAGHMIPLLRLEELLEVIRVFLN
jgi:predicted alpha/beta hydrolase family esterase